MSVAINTSPSADELLRMPDYGMARELIAGAVRVMSPPGFEHGVVAAEIARVLADHVKRNGIAVTLAADTGLVLAREPDPVRPPDAALVARERADALATTRNYWPAAPDLAVELVSPGDGVPEVRERALGWLAAGTIAVLVLDPANQSGTVYRGHGAARVHTGSDTIDLSDAVPGFTLGLAELFR